MNKAVELSAQELGIDVREFAVTGVSHDPLFAHHWYIGTDTPGVDADRLRDCIDAHLTELNDDYAVERRHALKDIFLTVVPAGLFYKWMESKGKLGGQHKFPRVLKKALINDWETFLLREGIDVECVRMVKPGGEV